MTAAISMKQGETRIMPARRKHAMFIMKGGLFSGSNNDTNQGCTALLLMWLTGVRRRYKRNITKWVVLIEAEAALPSGYHPRRFHQIVTRLFSSSSSLFLSLLAKDLLDLFQKSLRNWRCRVTAEAFKLSKQVFLASGEL